ncbi:thiamine pyrophosphate-binding protein [Paracoccus kondratievae]
MRHGGQILVDALKANGVGRVFSVPGESFLAVLDGLHASGIQNIVCRHEGGAAMMAEAHGKLTGRPGWLLSLGGPARPMPVPGCMWRGRIDADDPVRRPDRPRRP